MFLLHAQPAMSFWAKRSTKVSNQSHASEYLLLAASVPYFFQVWSSCGISFESYGAFLITCSTALWLCDQGGTASDETRNAPQLSKKMSLELQTWKKYGTLAVMSKYSKAGGGQGEKDTMELSDGWGYYVYQAWAASYHQLCGTEVLSK